MKISEITDSTWFAFAAGVATIGAWFTLQSQVKQSAADIIALQQYSPAAMHQQLEDISIQLRDIKADITVIHHGL